MTPTVREHDDASMSKPTDPRAASTWRLASYEPAPAPVPVAVEEPPAPRIKRWDKRLLSALRRG